jgi:hypothetical protein
MGAVRAQTQAVDGNDSHGGHRYVSVGGSALFRGE